MEKEEKQTTLSKDLKLIFCICESFLSKFVNLNSFNFQDEIKT